MTHPLPVSDRVAILVDEDGVARVTLTRGDKLNALDPAMFEAPIAAGQALFDLPGLRCVVLSGEGKAFSAGLDLATFEAALGGKALPLTQRTHGNANHFQQAALVWRKLPVPVIAAVHGVCMGGGLQIAAGADIRVVAPETRMAVLEMKWGLVPDMGGFALWRGCVREDVLRKLTYTNREFSGEEALEFGFATVVDANPVARAVALAQDIARRSPSAVRAAKSLFNRSGDLPLDDILAAESFEQQRLLGTRNQIEAMMSQTEKRPANFVDP
ncbi:crotonase/enoyl-CoA hydratase family protein [Novosphingobium sp. JCM 18896]|uniref:crotonase/enoyl-CoA hydratase family protein n=1 Tax=Novosphingobium sp. JCM 18896 TaxID=2989731 RepID=UPI002223612A|nr:crotonase/enoyl-CoA hydratase family protein [Novosphingobium sp. JCM 18896]MCW1428696.1 crotonase/enoyl-CoA hydratase family protein [Novosphingobium sp. JCM 18896]